MTDKRFSVRSGAGASVRGRGHRARARKAISACARSEPSGAGILEPLQGFMTNPAGAAVVNAVGPIRQLVRGEDKNPRRYLVILPGTLDNHGAAAQIQRE